jgi:hypothetical protein
MSCAVFAAALWLVNGDAKEVSGSSDHPALSRIAGGSGAESPLEEVGHYLCERQWGTVREDYGDNGDAWSYFSDDQARSRAYHWGEDGLAGFSERSSSSALCSPCGMAQ